MKKKGSILWLVLVLCVGLMLPVMSAETVFGAGEEDSRLQDEADLLADEEAAELLHKLDEISERQGVDLVVVTVDSLGGRSAMEAADDYYDDHGYGQGANRDGVLLLHCPWEREWWISTCGYGITAFTDEGIEYIGEQITPYLSGGDFAQAYETFAELGDRFLTQAKTGEAYDRGKLPREPLSLIWLPISLALGLALALVFVASMKGQLKTVRRKAAARDYVRKDSMQVTVKRDQFLYHTVTRKERPKKESAPGGSSTHHSASGTRHGGGGGRY